MAWTIGTGAGGMDTLETFRKVKIATKPQKEPQRADKIFREVPSDITDKFKELPEKSDLQSDLPISIELGNSYIMNEQDLANSLTIFKQLLKNNTQGLCITRTHPDKIRKDHKLTEATIKWLSKDICDFSVPPVLEKLSHVIIDFYRKHENSVVILDGLEYLKTNNDFNRILKFIDHLKDLVFMYKCTLILPINYKIFPEDEIALLKKNMIEITST